MCSLFSEFKRLNLICLVKWHPYQEWIQVKDGFKTVLWGYLPATSSLSRKKKSNGALRLASDAKWRGYLLLHDPETCWRPCARKIRFVWVFFEVHHLKITKRPVRDMVQIFSLSLQFTRIGTPHNPHVRVITRTYDSWIVISTYNI